MCVCVCVVLLGRYRYESQPEICGWNLLMLSQSLAPLGMSPAAMQAVIDGYEDLYTQEYNRLMRNKMGLGVYKTNNERAASSPSSSPAAASSAADAAAAAAAASSVPASSCPPSSSGSESESESEAKYSAGCEEMAGLFLATLSSTGGDFTNCFRCLSRLEVGDASTHESVLDYLVSQCSSLESRLAQLAPRIPAHQLAMVQGLMRTNPELFARPGMEHQLELIQAEIARANKRDQLRRLDPALKTQQDRKEWGLWLEMYIDLLRADLEQARNTQPDALESELYARRARVQNAHNPKYILRNWVAQSVIEHAEQGNFHAVTEALHRLKDPYALDELDEREQQRPLSATTAPASASTAAAPKCVLHWNREKPAWVSTHTHIAHVRTWRSSRRSIGEETRATLDVRAADMLRCADVCLCVSCVCAPRLAASKCRAPRNAFFLLSLSFPSISPLPRGHQSHRAQHKCSQTCAQQARKCCDVASMPCQRVHFAF